MISLQRKDTILLKLTGWVIYNGNLQSADFLDFAKWIEVAATKKNIDIHIKKNNELLAYMTSDSLHLLPQKESVLPDFVIFADKDIYLAKQLELLGIPVFNSANAIEISDDKIATYQVLAKHKLDIPQTIIAPKIFYKDKNMDINFTKYVAQTLGFPLIIKEAFGSFGEQVYMIHTYEEMIEKVEKLISKPFLFQEFITSSFGKDIRLQVVGNQVVASMLRKSANDFRANITAGGTMKKYDPTIAETQLAITATQAIGADFAGVDLLFGKDGKPIICEINSNAHIRNLFDCTGINVADFMIDHIIRQMR